MRSRVLEWSGEHDFGIHRDSQAIMGLRLRNFRVWGSGETLNPKPWTLNP